jgi:hypothetical protein
MKWLIPMILILALLCGYALRKANRLEAEMTPRIQLIADAAR